MKTVIYYFSFVIATLLISCTQTPMEQSTSVVANIQYPVQPVNVPIYSNRELIVQFNSSTTAFQKDSLRATYHVKRHEICNHCDGTLEKWDFGPDVDLESKLGTIDSGSGDAESILRVEKEFGFKYETEDNPLTGGSGNIEYASKIVSTNAGVTIAVLDSGIDAHYPALETLPPFLFNASEHGDPEIESGWNYVTENNNTYDNYELVHGTGVTKILITALNSVSVPFQILPIKVANNQGKVSKFDFLCGYQFATQYSQIIQASLGWYDMEGPDNQTNDIFSNLIENVEDEVLLVTSAGNRDNNNDVFSTENYPHYPSGYNLTNVTSVAAANYSLTNIAPYSNYGESTVDFISRGTYIPFVNAEGLPAAISGTSFSAPQVSAAAAKILYDSGMNATPAEIITGLIDYGTPVEYDKPMTYNIFINL